MAEQQHLEEGAQGEDMEQVSCFILNHDGVKINDQFLYDWSM